MPCVKFVKLHTLVANTCLGDNMKLKTVLSAIGFFATLPCALLGLAGGEIVAQTLDVDWGFGTTDTHLVVCYKGKSLFADSISIRVGGKHGYCFIPAVSCGWRPQISAVCMRDGQQYLLVTLGDKDQPFTHFLLYQITSQQAELVCHNKIFN